MTRAVFLLCLMLAGCGSKELPACEIRIEECECRFCDGAIRLEAPPQTSAHCVLTILPERTP
jgi:hypothetical protein